MTDMTPPSTEAYFTRAVLPAIEVELPEVDDAEAEGIDGLPQAVVAVDPLIC
jgi:hypothetical protein